MARIIVIEDNAANLELMLYLLSAFGHHGEGHADGISGAEAVHANPPDLVICDIQLPGLNGYEIIINLRAAKHLDHIKIVAVTAMAMRGDSDKALKLGFDGYIDKPIDPNNFVAEVEFFLPENMRVSKNFTQREENHLELAQKTPTRKYTGKILLVDDHLEQRELSSTILNYGGYKVDAVSSSKEAISKLHQEKFDLILSDVNMPEMSGFDLLLAAKKLDVLHGAPFLLISSTSPGIDNQNNAKNLGADMFISRPIEAETLLTKIAHCMKQTGERNA
ncbi:MAG: response regulator [Zhongshania sp.]|nr:response regulator [Zhongshania sp.]